MPARTEKNTIAQVVMCDCCTNESQIKQIDMKKQIFIDGNKRTSIIFANHYLISKGKGIIVIPAELTDEYKDLLINYYEGKDKTKIKKFLKEKCFMKIQEFIYAVKVQSQSFNTLILLDFENI